MTEPSEELRSVIEKTVDYVRRNGKSFEKKLEASSSGKFPFLNPSNEHYHYYKRLLENDGENSKQEDNKEEEASKHIRELKFVVDLPAVSESDLDIIKLTALFVARNGDEYANRIYSFQKKVKNGAQFEFLNKEHTLYGLFSRYVSQYRTLNSIYESDETEQAVAIDNYLKDPRKVYEYAYERAKIDKSEKTHIKKEKQERENKLLYYASIDWHDFAIVEKVEFDAIDQVKELDVPVSRDSLIYRSLENKHDKLERVEEDVQTTEVQPTKPNAPFGMKIKAAGESRLKHANGGQSSSSTSEPTLKCPLTGKQIPESKFDDHLKVLLRDPRYKEQQDNFMKKNFKYSSNLSTDEVYNNIKRLMKKRDYTPSEDESKKRQIGPN